MQVTLNHLPDTAAEFEALPRRAPEEICTYFLCALKLYIKDKDAGAAAMDLRQKPSAGEWLLWEYSSFLRGIRSPAAQASWG